MQIKHRHNLQQIELYDYLYSFIYFKFGLCLICINVELS